MGNSVSSPGGCHRISPLPVLLSSNCTNLAWLLGMLQLTPRVPQPRLPVAATEPEGLRAQAESC